MKKMLSVLLVLVLVSGVFAGCGAKTPSVKESEPQVKEASSNNEEAAQSNDSAETVYFLSKILGNQYWSVVEQGAKDAAKDLGVNIVVTGLVNDSEIEKQVQQLQDAVSAGADAIVVAPCDNTALTNPVMDAFQSGTPVVLIDGLVSGEDYSAAVVTDNIDAGRVAAQAMLEGLKDSGLSEEEDAQIAVQIAATGSQPLVHRLEGFNAYWDENAPEKWVVLNNDIKVNDGDISKAITFTQDFLTTYPDLKGAYGANNGSTVGLVTGLKEAGRTDIVMVGADFSPEIIDMVNEGEFRVTTVVQQQYLMGYQSIETAVALARGEEISDKTVQTAVLAVDKNNINNPEVQKIINPS